MNNIMNYKVLFDKEMISLILLVSGLIIILLIMFLNNRQFDRSIRKLQSDIAQIKKFTEVQSTYLSQFNDHFTLTDRKLKNLEEITSMTSRDISAMAEGITGEVGIGKAIELARRGATVDELIESCNIQKDQAELIVKFHGSKDNRQPNI